jgi:hypothetical protein
MLKRMSWMVVCECFKFWLKRLFSLYLRHWHSFRLLLPGPFVINPSSPLHPLCPFSLYCFAFDALSLHVCCCPPRTIKADSTLKTSRGFLRPSTKPLNFGGRTGAFHTVLPSATKMGTGLTMVFGVTTLGKAAIIAMA